MMDLGDAFGRLPAVARTFLAHWVLAEFEDMPDIRFHFRDARAVKKAIEVTDHDAFTLLKKPVGRNAFVAAAADHLAPIVDCEELIVGLGHRFYLVDERRLGRFWLPSVEKIAMISKALGIIAL